MCSTSDLINNINPEGRTLVTMSEVRNISTEKNKIVINPLRNRPILPKFPMPILTMNKNGKITLINNLGAPAEPMRSLNGSVSDTTRSFFKEDVIYESKAGDFLGNTQYNVTIINRLSLPSNCSRTIAKYTACGNDLFFEKTSDSVSKLIGQSNYDTVFLALCSVISQELKVKGMLALLTLHKKFNNSVSQTDTVELEESKSFKEQSCQTDESAIDLMFKEAPRKRVRRAPLTPYVVKDNKKKIVVDPKKAIHKKGVNKSPETPAKSEAEKPVKVEVKKETEILQDLKQDVNALFIDETSNGSIGSIGNLSTASKEQMLTENPEQLLNLVSQQTEPYSKPSLLPNSTMIRLLDGSEILVPVKPEDHFHIAIPEILENVTKEEKMKLLCYQAYIDWKLCMIPDEDGNLPIHMAVQNNDAHLLRRQCIMLKNRNESVDVPACNMTALQMSLFQNSPLCTATLLQHGADPLANDEESRTLLHLAAELSTDHLRTIVAFCRINAGTIMREHDDLWCPEYSEKSKEELAKLLLDHACRALDNQGYTPLMIASKTGIAANVKLLIECSPDTVNISMPNSGYTALYLAVGDASLDAARRGNKSKVVDNFRDTIKTLVANGADPNIATHAGANVNDLLTEFAIPDLTVLVASAMNTTKLALPEDTKALEKRMLVKVDGQVSVADIDAKGKRPKTKPVILEDVKVKIEDVPTHFGSLKAIELRDRLKKLQAENAEFASQNIAGNKNPEDGNMVVQNDMYVNEVTHTKTGTVVIRRLYNGNNAGHSKAFSAATTLLPSDSSTRQRTLNHSKAYSVATTLLPSDSSTRQRTLNHSKAFAAATTLLPPDNSTRKRTLNPVVDNSVATDVDKFDVTVNEQFLNSDVQDEVPIHVISKCISRASTTYTPKRRKGKTEKT